MKILILTTSFPGDEEGIGGTFVYNEALAYSLNGAKVKVLTPQFNNASKQKTINENCEVIRFQYFWPRRYQVLVDGKTPLYGKKRLSAFLNIPFFVIFFFLHVLKHAKAADIIHCQWTATALFAMPAKWLFHSKIVVTARGSDIRLMPEGLNKWIFRKVDAAIDCYGPQPWNEQNKLKFPSNYLKLPLIINPDDFKKDELEQQLSNTAAVLNILYLGRIDLFKLQQNQLPLFELVDVVDQLNHKGLNVVLTIIGGGDKAIEVNLREQIQTKSFRNRLRYLGFKSNPQAIFQNINLGVGGIAFNTVSQEFSFHKIPQVLMNNADNCNTPWKHLENCFLINPGSPEDLRKTLELVIHDKPRLRRVAEQAYDLAKDLIKDPHEGGRLYLEKLSDL